MARDVVDRFQLPALEEKGEPDQRDAETLGGVELTDPLLIGD